MTTDEIVRALRCCADHSCSAKCPAFPAGLDCREEMHKEVLALIKRLTAENAVLPNGEASAIESLRKEIEGKDMVIALAQRKQAEAEAERDAMRERVPQWISVEDRLPEVWKNERTGELVNYIVRSPYFGVDIGNYHKEAGTWLCMGLPCTVTHWMPLPEAPEVE